MLPFVEAKLQHCPWTHDSKAQKGVHLAVFYKEWQTAGGVVERGCWQELCRLQHGACRLISACAALARLTPWRAAGVDRPSGGCSVAACLAAATQRTPTRR